jgi:alpha-tubulin suppressor-like RCC1 family protein
MMLSEKLTERHSASGRLVMVLMVGLAMAVALSMAFAGDAEAKKKKKKPRKPPNTNVPAPTPNCNQPPMYNGESVARAWGDNDYGKLGDESTTDRNAPVGVSNLSGVQTVAGGGDHSLALKEDCTVWAWGDNYNGKLGDGTTTERRTPVQVQNLGRAKAIAAGTDHSLALKNDGTLWAWGYNFNGQLGDGTTTDRTTPVQVSNLSGVKAIAVGDYHSLALKEDGTLWAWGRNAFGQLGDGTSENDRATPVQVSNLSDVKAMDAGEDHSVALRTDGTVFAWGGNSYGQLGDGTSGTERHTPVQVRGEPPTNAPPSSSTTFLPWDYLSGVKAISAAEYHSLALMEDGTVRAWGANSTGQLGDGSKDQRNKPVQVSYLNGVKAIDAGALHSVALKTDGTVRAWGDNYESQLGNGTNISDSTTPVQVSNLSDVKVIAAGDWHNLAKVVKPLVAQP